MRGTIDPHSLEQNRPRRNGAVVYVGFRRRGRAIVKKHPDQERLNPERSLKLATHSPSGFGWGYSGSGPAQLALALLLNYTEDEGFALDHYQEFKTEVVSQLECTGPDGCWRLTDGDIDAVLRDPSEEAVTPSL